MTNLAQVNTGIRKIITIGNIWHVDDDHYVKSDSGENIMCDHKSNSMPLRIIHDNMEVGDYTILNPFAEQLTLSSELRWFYTGRSVYIGHLMRELIIGVLKGDVTIPSDAKDDIHKLKNKDKLISIIEDIKANDVLAIVYLHKQKVTILRSRILTDPKDYGISATQLTQITTIIDILLDDNALDAFTTTPTFDKLPRYSSFFGCMLKLLEVLISKMGHLENQIELDDLREHLTNTQIYYKLASWCVSSTPPSKVIEDSPSMTNIVSTPMTSSPQRHSYLDDAEDNGNNEVVITKDSGLPVYKTNTVNNQLFTEPQVHGFGGQQLPSYGMLPPNPQGYPQQPVYPQQGYPQQPVYPQQGYPQQQRLPQLQQPIPNYNYMQPNMGMQPNYNYTPGL